MAMKFYKLLVLPGGALEPDAFYYIDNGTVAESYVTDAAGTAKAIGNTAMVTALITGQLNALKTLEKVATIAARNTAKATATRNTMYLVVDATGDPTVTAGAALYFYDKAGDTFTKISEYESMDVVTAWANISGRPNRTAAAIEQAVDNSHTHANKATLDKLGESGGSLTYNGAAVGGGDWTTKNW